jgi:hypothetical protein
MGEEIAMKSHFPVAVVAIVAVLALLYFGRRNQYRERHRRRGLLLMKQHVANDTEQDRWFDLAAMGQED